MGFLLFIVLISGGYLFLSPGIILGKKTVHIDFWNGFTGPDGRVMLKIVRQFNEANPGIKVTMQRLPWALYYNKLLVAALDHRGPQVFVIPASALTRMVHAGFIAKADVLYSGQDGVSPKEFDSYVMNQVMFDHHPVGLPLDVHPQGMFINVEMLKKAGFVNPDGSVQVPTNRAEFMAVAKKLLNRSTPNGENIYGFALTDWMNNFQSLMPQFGGYYVDKNGNAALDNPGNLAALTFLQNLRFKYRYIPPPDNQLGLIGLEQNRIGMAFDGIYMLGQLQSDKDLQYLGAPIPQIGPHPGVMADAHILCFQKGLSPNERNASIKFIEFLSKHSIEWAAAGQVPARKDVRATPQFQKMQVQSAFAKQIPYMMFPPRIVTLFEFENEVSLAVERVIRGNQTPKAALEEANQNAQAIIDRERKNQSIGGTQS